MSIQLVSFVLLAYNQEKYIRAAIEGAFAQTYSPLEIILSDDCSSDRTFDIMKEMASGYDGPHKILLNLNPINLGLGRHYNRAMELVSGEIVELAAGDDISLPERTNDTWKILNENPEIMCVSLGIHRFQDNPYHGLTIYQEHNEIVQFGITDFVSNLGFHINAPARAFRKFTHDYFGPLNDDCPVEDGPNLLRCLLHGQAAYCGTTGVLYRWHGANMSTPENLRRISFELIYKEYESSILCAFNKGLITHTRKVFLCKMLAARLKKMNICINFETSNYKIYTYVRHILFSRLFSVREKAKQIFLTLK